MKYQDHSTVMIMLMTRRRDQLAHARYQSLEFAARLRVVKLELEKDQTRTKQSKVNSSWLKAAKNKMIKPFGSWISTCRKTVVDFVYTNSLLETIREVSPDVRAPSYELSDIYLPEDDPQPKWTPPFRYSVDQQPQDIHCSECESERHLSPSSSHDRSEGGGGGKGGGYDTYGGVLNNYGYSLTYTNCPPPIRHPDNPPIINQGTINYRDHHYYRQTFYSGDSTSSDQSWIDSTASSIFYPPQESYGVNQNNNDTYQEPPHMDLYTIYNKIARVFYLLWTS
ncbi:LOW QUALITY PROTEIN: hypothetical protein Cgig2_016822 [Carnegiea gigantea]|uniref:Uncharacterized protein n=1 Tax=Carnegiea gigantea TaxID=171969 RepID=A0A9Q1JSF8_9CARY|nr:LOW QUALITY PROTEIN: hypothetical protein Cgig2_016822 [Carnegiea gigantea]